MSRIDLVFSQHERSKMCPSRTPALPSCIPAWLTAIFSLALAAWPAGSIEARSPSTVAEPGRVALVMGNADYLAFPALPGCPASAGLLRDALAQLDFDVVIGEDLSSGGMAATISDFSHRLEAAPDPHAVVYFCGYAAGLSKRPFLLPVSARLERATDLMTQGILLKALLNVLASSNAEVAFMALDLAAAPGAEPPALESLASVPLPDGAAMIAVDTTPSENKATPLAQALLRQLAVPDAETGDLLSDLRDELMNQGIRLASVREPTRSASLVPTPPPPSEPVAETPAPAPAPAAPPATPTNAAASATTDARIPPRPASAPAEAEMSGVQRRLVQEALARVGYYAGAIDGLFGPETRAAIRRFQHEIGAEKTGELTGGQAARLLSWQ